MLPFEPALLKVENAGNASKPRYYTAADYHEMYKAGKVTPLQVIETILAAIQKNQSLPSKYEDAWLETGKDAEVREAARASTERYSAGKPLGVLDGVPVGIKDDLDIKGYASNFGMKPVPGLDFFKEKKKTVWPVQKLQEAGAIVVGKNKMHECGADTNGLNIAQGTPTNHLNTSYYPGGSSSGGCSALGAGVVPIVLGTDAGGSTRIPAAFNGVYGMKTTHHRTMHFDFTTCVCSPIAASVADLTIAYRTISQPDPDQHSGRMFALSKPPAPGVKKVMGIYRDWWKQADPRVQEICEKAVAHFAENNGYEIVDISIPFIAEARMAHGAICVVELAEMARRRTPNPADWLSIVGPTNKILLSVAALTPGADYLEYNALREVMMRHLAFLFQKYPGLMIMTPVTPLIGWGITPGDESYGLSDTNTTIKNMMYIFLANLVGTPAVTAPVGYVDPEQGEGRLPIGMQAMGEWGSEEQLLAWAGEAEKYLHEAVDGGRRRPKTWFDVLGKAKEGLEAL